MSVVQSVRWAPGGDAVRAGDSALRNLGYEVSVVLDGPSALERVRMAPPDLLISDIMMPGMDGYETTAAIREMPQYRALPIIALTAKAMKADRDRCIEAGASDYISKPLDIDQLLSLLRVWLYRQEGALG